MSRDRVCVLTIAGSDPSGGAGVQSDLRAFSAMGLVGLSAITALTVQNSRGVLSVHPTPPELLRDQIDAVLDDSSVGAVKIGMLGGAEQVRVVADALRRYNPPTVVLDPVLASTGGFPLLDDSGLDAMLEELIPLCDLITPNLPEMREIAGRLDPGASDEDQVLRCLVERGARAVLVKGGHLNGRPIDRLVRTHDVRGVGPVTGERFISERVQTPHSHGTGCLLSSLIAAYLAQGRSLTAAIPDAKRLLTRALGLPVVVGRGAGYPDIEEAIRIQRLWPESDPTGTSSACDGLRGQLYVITDSEIRPDRPVREIARAALAGGAGLIQLRAKGLSMPDLVAEAKCLVAMCREAGALLIVNDRVDVALAAAAHGVHLGPDDMHPRDAREILGPDRLIGVSTGTVEEAKALAPYASYLGVGAIFGSKTKLDAGEAVGIGRIREIRDALGAECPPIVAIGGITAENIAEVAAAGADCAAVISAVITAPDMYAATAELVARFRGR